MYDRIIKLSKQNGNLLKEKAGNIKDIGVIKKYLTELDLKIERDFIKLISQFEGEHQVFAEEENDILKPSENLWIIDPISGTFNFINGFPHYAIVISRLVNNKVIFALVYDPALDELYIAEKGKGTTLNGKRVKVNNKKSADSVILYEYSTDLFGHKKGLRLMEELCDLGKIKKSFGSMGIQYSYVACGRASAAVAFNKDMFPEFAGKLLVEEAGGKTSDFAGEELKFKSRGVIFSNGLIHDEVLKITLDY